MCEQEIISEHDPNLTLPFHTLAEHRGSHFRFIYLLSTHPFLVNFAFVAVFLPTGNEIGSIKEFNLVLPRCDSFPASVYEFTGKSHNNSCCALLTVIDNDDNKRDDGC